MKPRQPHPIVSAVVPVFRSEGMLEELTRRLHQVLQAHYESFEVILVEDGGEDNAWQVIRTLAEKHAWVRGIRLMRNYGQHNALLCGIRAARGDVIVTLDDDLQHSPEDIPALVSRLNEGFDVVYGCPAEPQHGSARNHVTKLTKLMLKKAMGIRLACEVSAFRAMRADVRAAFAHYRSPFVSIDVLLSWATTRFASVPIRHEPRRSGESNYTVGKLINYTMNLITGFTVVPLRLASIIGFVFTMFGFLVLAYVIGRYFIEGSSVPGFPFLASIVAIFSGAQLFAMGILGEYLARMHLRMMERPAYTVQQTLNLSEEVIPYRELRAEMAVPSLTTAATLS